jgi:hypothetical protein
VEKRAARSHISFPCRFPCASIMPSTWCAFHDRSTIQGSGKLGHTTMHASRTRTPKSWQPSHTNEVTQSCSPAREWMQKRRWIAVTCWVAVGTEDDNISHAVAADDGVDAEGGMNEDDRARGTPHAVAAAWLRTGRRRRSCEPPSHGCGGGDTSERVGDSGVRLPLDGSGRVTRNRDGSIVESGAMATLWRSRVEDSHCFRRFLSESYAAHEFQP